MRLYEMLKSVSEALTPAADELYDYMLHTFEDDGGFLRTRWRWTEKPVDDFTVDLETVLVALRHPFTEGSPLYEAHPYWPGEQLSCVKMQLFYAPWGEDDVVFCRELRYPVTIVIDVKNRKVVPSPLGG